MNRYERYLKLATDLVTNYDGSIPFTAFLKKYFSFNRQLGSRDRRQLSMSCYAWFRVGKLLCNIEPAHQIAAARFLCHTSSDEILASLFPEWNEQLSLSIEDKCNLLNIPWNPSLLFPFSDQLSETIDVLPFVKSHFIQPDLFLRIRPGMEEKVKKVLHSVPFQYEFVTPHTLRLPNGIRVEDFFQLNKEVVVQDLSSQRLADLFQRVPFAKNESFLSWDACAASGGKSILLKDYFPDTRLTVSDKRNAILHNLQNRLNDAGILIEKQLVLDLSQPIPDAMFTQPFDFVFADVPCSGSGTWSRTPEWLHYFTLEKLQEYVELQYRIVQNIIPSLKQGGYLLYSTCSVYAAENEIQVKKIAHDFNLSVEASLILKGYDTKADTMYGALLKKL
jgi:16S rRNA (cytosine967-C5)-methyltransferase